MTTAYLLNWLELFFRWFHVIAGVAWIGASFYFIWLDNNLEEPPQEKRDRGIKGDLWAIHGGGYYEVAKYRLNPPRQPEKLHWFKWEAYTTWLTGMVLMVLIYYVGAQSYLVDSQNFPMSTLQAVSLSLASLLVGLAVYEGMIRSPLRQDGRVFGLVLFVLLTLYAWAMTSVFSGRGAYIQVGALIGTIMAGNVLLGIIPAQRALVRAVNAGTEPDPEPALLAKLRSTHNNYFTLPIIFIMISNHYPMTYGHELNWLVLALVCGISAFARHFFNLRHQGKTQVWILVVALTSLAAVAWWMAPQTAAPGTAQEDSAELISESQMDDLVVQHCTACHAASPSSSMFSSAPGGLIYTSGEDTLSTADRVITSLRTQYMPLGNPTNMTAEERDAVIQWIEHNR